MKIVLDTNCLIPVLVPGSFEVDVRTLAEFLNIVRSL